MKNDAYGTPRNCWSSHGSHVYSTSQDNSVYGWDIGTEKVVSVMKGHTSMVRDLVSHRDSDFNMLATASYDKTVRLWGV